MPFEDGKFCTKDNDAPWKVGVWSAEVEHTRTQTHAKKAPQ